MEKDLQLSTYIHVHKLVTWKIKRISEQEHWILGSNSLDIILRTSFSNESNSLVSQSCPKKTIFQLSSKKYMNCYIPQYSTHDGEAIYRDETGQKKKCAR